MDIKPDDAHFELAETDQPTEGDAIVETDPAHRLLTLWGRCAPHHPVAITADPKLWSSVARVLWDATP